jgi:8-oxo-dGTP pyrophosphatase MutT (NUDIX family)
MNYMTGYSPLLHLVYESVVFFEGIIGLSMHGAQAIVPKGDSVLLVRTRYRPFWELPGGKAEKYEAPEVAAIRETKEEARVFIKSFDRKLGTYTHNYLKRRVTIHVYIADEWEELDLWVPNMEISERQFFLLNDLPKDTSPHTLKRLEEYKAAPVHEFSGTW